MIRCQRDIVVRDFCGHSVFEAEASLISKCFEIVLRLHSCLTTVIKNRQKYLNTILQSTREITALGLQFIPFGAFGSSE